MRKYVPKPALTCKVRLLVDATEDADALVGLSERAIVRTNASVRLNTRQKIDRKGTPPPYTSLASRFIRSIVGAHPCGRPGGGAAYPCARLVGDIKSLPCARPGGDVWCSPCARPIGDIESLPCTRP